MMSFQFHPIVQNWFHSNFVSPSPAQAGGWPSIAAGHHTLILAPTGSGKTLAAFLWCIDELVRKGLTTRSDLFCQNPEGVHTLYISPLKALDYDIHRNLELPLQGIRKTARKMGLQPRGIRVSVRTGDTPGHIRQTMVKKPPHILITTPESLYLLLTSLKGREIFRHLRYVIVDEIHAMSGNKRGVHLSLSLERLNFLSEGEPIRIGLSATQRPLQRVAAYLGGQRYDPDSEQWVPRPVSIVDCGQRKAIDLKVITPVEDFGDLPGASVWPAVYEKLYQMITTHRSTLVFVNMRAQTEKIARELNRMHQERSGDKGEKIALAHHGSISRQVRLEVEQRLQAGEIPAVIATASLELGIDIGSIELVVQVESPRTITSMLQRVGRSGHLLHSASKGRIIPLYPGDLGPAVALTRSALRGDIEETIIPENCLDVLAQQIAAEVSMQDWPRKELFRLVRQSYCYRDLSETAFQIVLEMLCGRFADSPLQALQPRITWDRSNDRLLARRGTRLHAVMNSGTIPDRGYYGVYLADTQVKLGDMEEEFVFESRVGDTFFLGNQEWRIEDIKNDRILVRSGISATPRPPFWKGGHLFRDYATQAKIARFRREFQYAEEKNSEFMKEMKSFVEPAILRNLKRYFQRQIEHTGRVATDRQILVEYFRDVSNEPHLVVHSPFGARVNGAWAIALSAVLEQHFHVQIQYDYDDNGIIIRLPGLPEPPHLNWLFQIPIGELEQKLLAVLPDTQGFSIYFRYNATRALLLERSRKGHRIPLWIQRLRAAELLQAVRHYSEFPIVIETVRECVQEVFDLHGLRQVLTKIHSGDITVHFLPTPSPSPMTSSILFRFLANSIYEEDRARYPARAALFSQELLAEVLAKESVPAIIPRELVEKEEKWWRYETPERKAKNKEELFTIIENLGPIAEGSLHWKAEAGWPGWLKQLQEENRICQVQFPFSGWIVSSEAKWFRQEFFRGKCSSQNFIRDDEYKHKDAEVLARRVLLRYLRTRGPVEFEEIASWLPAPREWLRQQLEKLRDQKEVVHGRLVRGSGTEQWCERQNFARLYRQAIALRRQYDEPISRANFYRFLLRWHGIHEKKWSIQEVITKYRGLVFPVEFFEREILRTRIGISDSLSTKAAIEEIEKLIAAGEVIVRAVSAGNGAAPAVQFFRRGEGHLFYDREELVAGEEKLDPRCQRVLQFIQKEGASLFQDIVLGTDLAPEQLQEALVRLIQEGLITCDQFQSFRAIMAGQGIGKRRTRPFTTLQLAGRAGGDRSRHRPARSLIRRRVQDRMLFQHGRWFWTGSLAVFGKETGTSKAPREKSEDHLIQQAELLLQRYGIMVKEWHRKEHNSWPWYPIFQTLKRLEWQGEIRRGYFVAGLSGVQFALPEALTLLENIQETAGRGSSGMTIVSTADPALPFGGFLGWEIRAADGGKIPVTRSVSNHLFFRDEIPVAYSENYGSRLWFCGTFRESWLDELIENLKVWMKLPLELRPRKTLRLEKIDDLPAAGHLFVVNFLRAGFEKDDERLILWPSRV